MALPNTMALPVRKNRTFSFTPSKPHKPQRIREYILYCKFSFSIDFPIVFVFIWF